MTRPISSFTVKTCNGISAVAILLFLFVLSPSAFSQQTDNSQVDRSKTRQEKDPDQSPSVGEMVVKQQISRRKKEHDELLSRGEEALKLSEDLEKSLSVNESLDAADLEKLESLEKVVGRIRKDLGGDDEEEIHNDSSAKENSARSSVAAAFKFLRESTRSLVDELKRTSRFSISALAIHTSNTVIRFARFLRLKK